MKAIVLAAGSSSRLYPITKTVPKCLLEVQGIALIDWAIKALPEQITELIFIVHTHQDQIKDYLGSRYQNRVVTFIDQTELKGTAHALYCAKDLIEPQEKFITLNADEIMAKTDLQHLCAFDFGMIAVDMGKPSEHGAIQFDKQGNVSDVIEYPTPAQSTSHFSNINCFILPGEVFKAPLVPKKTGSEEFGLPQTVLQFAKDHHRAIKVVKTKHWVTVNTSQDWEKAKTADLSFVLEK